MLSDDEPVLVAVVTFLYLEGSGCLEIRDHEEYPRWVVDCNEPGEVDQYCVMAQGSIGGFACPDGDCLPAPVQSETWGAIKSLYR
jgi:hypothetical protein